MSTAPRNPTDSCHAAAQAAVLSTARPDLDEAVRRFEAAAERFAVEPPPFPELRRLCGQVAGFAAELFPGEMRVEVKNDPEIPDDVFFRFGVDATGTLDDIAARNDEWHARVCRLPARFSGMFRLSIAVR
jgi:hypothetical protein